MRTRSIKRRSRLHKRGFGIVKCKSRSTLARGGVIDQRHEISRFGALFQHIDHARAVRAQKTLQVGHALLLARKRFGVELHFVAIASRIASHIFEHVTRLAERTCPFTQLSIIARRAFERGCGRPERIERPLFVSKRLMGRIDRTSKRLGVFRLRKRGGQLFIFPFLRVHRINARKNEPRLLELRRRGRTRIAHARKLRRSDLNRIVGFLVRGTYADHRLLRPSVEKPHMGSGFHELLVLVLAT